MKVLYLAFLFYGFVSFELASSQSLVAEAEFDNQKQHNTVSYEYDRIDEVNQECAFVRKSAVELNKDSSIKQELSFKSGDWWQDVGDAPLLPYGYGDVMDNSTDRYAPLKLVSFRVTDVDHVHRSKKFVFVSGLLTLGITLADLVSHEVNKRYLHFLLGPHFTQLSISFQGIYTESKKGERVMCLLGSTMLPAREEESSDPWEWAKVYREGHQPPLLQDDRLLLVLRYPMTFTLTSRAIRGNLRSLNSKSNLKYFDEIHMISQFGESVRYEFGSHKIVSRACDPYPTNDSMINNGISVYKGHKFCTILKELTLNQGLMVVSNWRCNGTDEFCSRFGPFASEKEIKATDGGFSDVNLFMQHVNCEQKNAPGGAISSRVSAVFRAVPPSEISHPGGTVYKFRRTYAASHRSGLSGMTISAEGIWNSSSGQLCMVGCLGIVDTESACTSRICMYFPISFSIKQRSIILGSFSSISKTKASYFPLSFESLMQPFQLRNHFQSSHPYYSYSKIDLAGAILEKDEPFSFSTVIKKSLLKFPKVEDSESLVTSLSLLSEDLTLQVAAMSDLLPNRQLPVTQLVLDIFSLGPLFGSYWTGRNESLPEEGTPYHSKSEFTEKQLLLNVSAQLTLTGIPYQNASLLFLEGLYDPHVGKMYLIGCRDVRASWKVLFESRDLDAGLDCLINVVVSYPPISAQWLVNPTAKISIASERNEDDPLHFDKINLQTFPIMYRRQREDILSRRAIQGILRILTLTWAIACISSQLLYVKYSEDSVPYMSLVMLGVQALGYSLPLLTNAEALFRKMPDTPSDDLDRSQWIYIVDYAVKLLVMVSFLLTLRLCQLAWKSRIKLLHRTNLQSHRVPSEKRVLIATFIIHAIGYIMVLVFHGVKTTRRPFQAVKIMDSAGRVRTTGEWVTQLGEYIGLVHDFFLLPQVIGNIFWQLDCMPLRKLYYIGITLVRLLPHSYDYIRPSPVNNPYFTEEYEFVNPNFDFYSKFADVAIPTTAICLAVLVYIQQRWSYGNLCIVLGKIRLFPMRHQAYERVPSKSCEAELVPTSDVNSGTAKDHTENNLTGDD